MISTKHISLFQDGYPTYFCLFHKKALMRIGNWSYIACYEIDKIQNLLHAPILSPVISFLNII